jgi:hypothetical protein
MSTMLDDSQGTIFASAAGLIFFFGLVPAIPVVSTTSEKEEKHSTVFGLAFRRGDG